MNINVTRLQSALAIAIADEKFIGNSTKVDKAIDALTPKSNMSGTLKRIQGNALSDFLVKKDENVVGYSDQTRADKVKAYVNDKFKVHMEAPKTSVEATQLFNAAYPTATAVTDNVPTDGISDDEVKAA